MRIVGTEERTSVASLGAVLTTSLGLSEKVDRAAAKLNVGSGQSGSLDKATMSHTVYVLEWTGENGETWTNERRYSEFEKLKTALGKDKRLPQVKQLEALNEGQGRFPRKQASGGSKAPVVEQRRVGLEAWMGCVLRVVDDHFLVERFSRQVKLSTEVCVPDYEELSERGKEYTIYHLEWSGGDTSRWTASRRYSDFERLRKALLKDGCDILQLDALPVGGGAFPKKRVSGVSWEEFLDQRRVGLEAWLRAVVELHPAHPALLAFYDGGEAATVESLGKLSPMVALPDGVSRAQNPTNPLGRAIAEANAQVSPHQPAPTQPNMQPAAGVVVDCLSI
eukprot:SAG11_NODE_489_length_8994_cov_8.385904_7_plen_336_part_00